MPLPMIKEAPKTNPTTLIMVGVNHYNITLTSATIVIALGCQNCMYFDLYFIVLLIVSDTCRLSRQKGFKRTQI